MQKVHKLIPVALGLMVSFLLISCQGNELFKLNEEVGLNGSFETTDAGYPVNWAFFPNPESGDLFSVSVDQAKAQQGEQSVKLTADQGETIVGLRSRRIPVEPGKTYQISFAVQNDGCELQVRRIVQDGSGTDNRRSDIIVDTAAVSSDWEIFEETLLISEGEKSVVLVFLAKGPGTIWVDNVQVEETVE